MSELDLFARHRVVALLAAVAVFAAVICGSASARPPISIKRQLNAIARKFDALAARAADMAGTTATCPLTTAQVGAALPLSAGIQVSAFADGCAFYTGTVKQFVTGNQPVLLYVKESKGQINSEWLSGMGSRFCILGTSRNANGPTAYSLCGVTRNQREIESRAGLVQAGLAFDFETPSHKAVWTVSLMYAVHLKGFRSQDLENGLLRVVKSFS